MPIDKIVVVTQKTALEELTERFNTQEQARFYVTQMGVDFGEYEAAHEMYKNALETVRHALPDSVPHQFIERGFLPNFLFGENDLITTLGRDGLVVNTAKYLSGTQPILALNPDSSRNDGVLLPFAAGDAAEIFQNAVASVYPARRITMARATLNNGQTLHAVNDFFIGQRTHTSARYALEFLGKTETQSSSGLIVSTGAGSTGWFRSVLTGAAGIVEAYSRNQSGDVRAMRDGYRFDWEADELRFSVREPFPSRTTGAELVYGRICGAREELMVTSQMPQNGVLFSDGVEADYLEFNSGAVARIGVAERKVNLLVPHDDSERSLIAPTASRANGGTQQQRRRGQRGQQR